MEYSPNAMQSNANSRTTAFRDLGAQDQKQCLNILPGDISPHRFFKNSFQSFLLFSIHFTIVSTSDTAFKMCSPLESVFAPNATVSCAGAGHQNLCQSPSRKPSEASRQRQLELPMPGGSFPHRRTSQPVEGIFFPDQRVRSQEPMLGGYHLTLADHC